MTTFFTALEHHECIKALEARRNELADVYYSKIQNMQQFDQWHIEIPGDLQEHFSKAVKGINNFYGDEINKQKQLIEKL